MKTNKTLLALGTRIRKERLRRNLTQNALAKKAGINMRLLSAIERGEEDISLECLLHLAKALGTTAADLSADIDD